MKAISKYLEFDYFGQSYTCLQLVCHGSRLLDLCFGLFTCKYPCYRLFNCN